MDDKGVALLHRALQMLIGPDLISNDHDAQDRYLTLVHDIDEYMAQRPEQWAHKDGSGS